MHNRDCAYYEDMLEGIMRRMESACPHALGLCLLCLLAQLVRAVVC